MKIHRIYIHNFNCFVNFEFKVEGKSPLLVIGKNGTGKSTLLDALMIFQGIARGLVDVKQAFGFPPPLLAASVGLARFELEFIEQEVFYSYGFAVEPASDGKSYCVREESLLVGGRPVFVRKQAEVVILKNGESSPSFNLDQNLFALPIIQTSFLDDPIAIARRAIADMFVLQPIPQLIKSDANEASAIMVKNCETFSSWLLHLLSSWPAAYAEIDRYLKTVFPDFRALVTVGSQAQSIGRHYVVQFEKEGVPLPLLISKLSNGEKCQLIAAAIMAANAVSDGTVCVWDEPTNYLALNEVGQMMTALCSSFRKKGQLIVTAHSDEAILRFTDESTYVFSRKTHLDPVLPPVTLADLRERKLLTGDLATALRLGDVDYER